MCESRESLSQRVPANWRVWERGWSKQCMTWSFHFHSALALFQLKHFSQFWTRPSMSYPKDAAWKQKESREAVMVTGLWGDTSYKERLKRLLKFNLKKKKQSGKRVSVFRYIYSSGMTTGIICSSYEWQTIVKMRGLSNSKEKSC